MPRIYPQSEEDEREWIRDLSKRKDTDLVFAIVLNDGDRHIGVIGLHKIDHRQGLATAGAMIGEEDCWNQGFGTEALMLLLHYAFTTLNLRKVCSSAYAFNERSVACQKKCGLREEGRLVKQHRYEFGWVDEVLLAVFAEGFKPLWEKFVKNLSG